MKTVVLNDHIVAQSMAATFTGPIFECQAVYGLGIQAVVSAASSLNGTFKVQVTNRQTSDRVPTDWVDYTTLASKTLTANGVSFWEVPNGVIPFKWLRLVFTRTAGSGTMDATINGQRI